MKILNILININGILVQETRDEATKEYFGEFGKVNFPITTVQ
jgi:hypothetical protein